MGVRRGGRVAGILGSVAGLVLGTVSFRRQGRGAWEPAPAEGGPVPPVPGLADRLPDALLVYGPGGRVVYANQRACELLGYGCEELLYLSARDIRVTVSPGELRERMEEAGDAQVREEVYRRKDGTTLPVEVSQRRTGLVGRRFTVVLVRDITPRQEAYEALQSSEDRLAAAQRIARFGSWVYDYDRDEAYWSEELYRIFGFEPGSFIPTYRTFLRAVHPEDKEAVRCSVRETFDGREECSVDYRVVRPGGEVRYVHTDYEAVHDGAGRPLRQIGTVHDVTDRRLAEDKLAWLASFPENNPSPVFEVDLYGAVTYANPAAERAFPDLVSKGAEHPVVEALGLHDGREFQGGYEEIQVDGCFYHVGSSAAFHTGALQGGPEDRRVRVYATDITERRRLEEQLVHQAFHDSLTGLANRALFLDRLEHTLARGGAWRRELSGAVFFVDLDNFKAVNDSLGHEAGDRLLVAAGRRLSSCVRPADTVARLGGDEFTVLVEDVESEEEAALVAGRILDGFKAPFLAAGREVHVTASVGIVPRLSPFRNAQEVLRAADLAMYRAKETGKARGVVCERLETA